MNDKELKSYAVVCKHKHGNDKKYPIIPFYDVELYREQKEAKKKNLTGQRFVLVSRVVYAWFNDVCPEDYDVDHIDNNPFNNSISNLQLLTRKENLARRLQRNQSTCHLTDSQLQYFNEQKNRWLAQIDHERELINDELENLRSLENDYHYYSELCKSINEYKLYNQVREDYKERIDDVKAKIKNYRESKHYFIEHYNAWKKAYLSGEIDR